MEFRKRKVKRVERVSKKSLDKARAELPTTPIKPPLRNIENKESSTYQTNLEDKRFIVVQVSCELFEYSNLRKIEYVGSFDCKDRNYEQDKRLALFAYDVNECDPKELLNYWKTELENINKTATYTMRTIKVPVYKPNDEEEL